MKFFQSVTTLEELKKAYRKLAIKLHPDKGGNEKEFIAMKDEYDKLFDQLQRGSKTESSAYENNETYRNIIDALINFDLDIEIIGTWVWVRGNTYAIKDKLKDLGFKWAGKKKAWYWHDGTYQSKSRKHYSLDEIREMHNSEKIKSSSKAYKLNA